MSLVIRVEFEERNAGGEPRRPSTACAFSGCHEPSARRFEDWPLCATHHEAVLRNLRRPS